QKRMICITKITDLEYSKSFSNMTGAQLFMKLENLQATGSFKVRGAFNKITSVCEDPNIPKEAAIIAASAGNHAQGCAFSATKNGRKAVIFMPKFTPPLKIMATKGYGAEVVQIGNNFDEAFEESQKYIAKNGGVYVHPFNDKEVIAGQGVIALEIIEKLKDVDVILAPIGGGGLVSGLAIASKKINPNIKIYGVQAAGAPSMQVSIEKKEIITLPKVDTIADGIAVKTPGELTFRILRKYCDKVLTVTDDQISKAIYLLLQRGKLLAEPAGATAMAACLFNEEFKKEFKDKKIVPVISGGNINFSLIEQVIEKGMISDTTRSTIQVILPDQPGNLSKVINTINSSEGVNIHAINHERSALVCPIGKAILYVTIDIMGEEQLNTIVKSIRDLYFVVEVKTCKCSPEFAGKLNFYVNAVDDLL
ncbi:MAG: threonine ammonia-lyase, partial [Bacilli bacterium]|nr:threonine ammonia-lyase [Bacilli bacterium]